MTVKLLQDWYDTETRRQYRGGNLLTKDAATEAGLIALKMADANITGGTEYQAPAVSRNLTPPASLSLDPTTGAVTGLVGPDGGEVQLPEPLEPTVIADWVSLAATGAVCGSPCLINRIRCVTGSAVTLTVYDNAAASSGTVLYTGSLSAGQEANISTPIRAINGVRAVFASGSFEFQIQQEAA